MVAAGVLLVSSAEVDDFVDGEWLAGRTLRFVAPVALGATEGLEDVSGRMALNSHGTSNLHRSFAHIGNLRFEFGDAGAQTIGLTDTDLGRIHPSVELVGDGENVGWLFAARAADRESHFHLPALNRAYPTPQVGRNLFPTMQNLGFGHHRYFTTGTRGKGQGCWAFGTLLSCRR